VLGLPAGGRWHEVLNSDSALFGGSNVGNGGSIHATASPSHGFPHSAQVVLPPLATLWFVHEG
jgi:1,4-alpha-glucan branching enzyme